MLRCGCELSQIISAAPRTTLNSLGVWRNGSASDSRSEGWEFESLCPHFYQSAGATARAASLGDGWARVLVTGKWLYSDSAAAHKSEKLIRSTWLRLSSCVVIADTEECASWISRADLRELTGHRCGTTSSDTLPEWSKGVDSSSTSASCVGSNPTGVILLFAPPCVRHSCAPRARKSSLGQAMPRPA